jgi:hypothetical protein
MALLAVTLSACDASPNFLPQVAEMKTELQALNDKLQEPAIEPMTVFAKSGSPRVDFSYKPSRREAFVQRIGEVATEGGYTPSTERVDPAVVLTMCSPKARHRSLHVAHGRDGVVSVAISMSQSLC